MRASSLDRGLPESIVIKRDRELCRHEIDGFYNFFRLAWHTVETEPLSDNWHIKYLCRRLQVEILRIMRGQARERDVIICVPPRSSKSSIAAVFLNAWTWTFDVPTTLDDQGNPPDFEISGPEIPFLTCSYSGNLSEQHSIKTKTIIESDWYLDRWGEVFSLSRKKNTNVFYKNTRGGERQSSSVGGTVTGAGALVIIGDDLISVGESQSETVRKKAGYFYRNTMYNRLNNPTTGVRIIINQRTHEDDVVGSELARRGEKYQLINIPAEIIPGKIEPSPPELAEHYKDKLFDPKRFPRSALEDFAETMEDYNEQYLQSPKKPGGNIIKGDWFFRYRIADLYRDAHMAQKELVWLFEFDGAYTKKKANCPNVCIAYTVFKNRAYIRDVLRGWYSYTECLEELDAFVRRNGYTSKSEIHIEPKANGLPIVDGLIDFKGLNAIASYSPESDKLVMISGVAPTIRAGRVGVPDSAPWLKTYLDELEVCPNGKYWDQVDCTVMLIKNGLERSVLAYG